MDTTKKQPFLNHLAELRKRLFIVFLVVVTATGVGYFFVQHLIGDVIGLAGGKIDFIYISPPELFLAYVKLSLVAGITVSFPIIAYQIYAFLRPGLEKRERRYVLVSILGGSFFFAAGVVFSYIVVLPMVLSFFINMRMESIDPVMSVGSYIGFISTSLLSFGLVFEMPMLVLLLSRFGLVTSAFLQKNTKYILFGIVVVAAIITPPDVISQVLLVGPMLVLFEFSVFLAKLTERSKRKRMAQSSS
ncbi:twin-arginine translocase subunit TatC [Alkalibacter rhizosphaerae]|uniref:Sec-independent protein translocase protein TatC n=1 Tax=Alkalibacter rhizosphaerae TaxID=2815577 RepID=A0A975AI58_9FIRM|nr:twin-arginine translocase subunit TatC [Alkalibacter rhizosphaerae]QSX09127.1 twin-arginine translocase subunit TatC [Alkalibacter rhizosphaerae]